jgi:FAD/FMN-containing dehydrogenase
VAGYTLGGGVGFLARRHGLACNALTSLQLVTTDGRLVRADATHEPELFWALRGGGGDLGVVTELEFDLFDTPQLSAGALFWPIAAAAAVLRAWARWTRELPDELTSIGRLLRVPPAPEIPEALRGRAFAVVELAYLGAPADLDALLAPLRALGPQLDTIGEVSPAALGWLHMDPDQPIPATGDGLLLASLTDDAIDGLVAVAGAHVESPLVSVEIRHLDGALARSAPGAGVTARLPAPYGVYAVGPTPDATTTDDVTDHLRRVRGALEPWSSPANYMHFTTDRASCFAAGTGVRLAATKAAWDAFGLITSNEPL